MTDFFVDLSAGTNGTGTFASPWNRLTSVTGVTAGADKVWVRRVSFSDTATHINWAVPANVPIIGWPISGDDDYATRPSVAQSAWDSDPDQYATIDMADATLTIASPGRVVLLFGNSTYYVKRLSIIYRLASGMTGSTGSPRGCAALTATGCVAYLYNCKLLLAQSTTFSGALGCYALSTGNWASGAPSCTINAYNTIFECQGQHTQASCIDVAANTLGFYRGALTGCTLRLSGFSTTNVWVTYNGAGTYSENFPLVCYGCTFESVVARTTTNRPMGSENSNTLAVQFNTLVTGNRPVFRQCTFSLAPSPAYVQSFVTVNYDMFQCNVIGFDYFYSRMWARVHLSSFIQGKAGAYAGIYNEMPGGLLVIDRAEFQPGNTLDVTGVYGWPSTTIIRSVSQGTGGYSTTGGAGRIIIANIDGVAGTWKSMAREGTVETSANARVGGEAFSLLLRPTAGAGSDARITTTGLMSSRPGEDTLFVSLPSGSRTVTVYGYYTGFTAIPTTATLWLDVEYPTATGFVSASSRTSVPSALTSDVSTWSGLSGGVAFKMAVTMTVPADCVGAIRVSTIAFDVAGSAITIDPKPIVS